MTYKTYFYTLYIRNKNTKLYIKHICLRERSSFLCYSALRYFKSLILFISN